MSVHNTCRVREFFLIILHPQPVLIARRRRRLSRGRRFWHFFEYLLTTPSNSRSRIESKKNRFHHCPLIQPLAHGIYSSARHDKHTYARDLANGTLYIYILYTRRGICLVLTRRRIKVTRRRTIVRCVSQNIVISQEEAHCLSSHQLQRLKCMTKI